MGLRLLGTFFKKIGKGFGGALLKAGKVIANVADVPGVTTGVMMIPVAGPWLALALRRVDQAEEAFRYVEKSGAQKMALALEGLAEDFADAGIDEKRMRAAIELALLLLKKEALFIDLMEDSDGTN